MSLTLNIANIVFSIVGSPDLYASIFKYFQPFEVNRSKTCDALFEVNLINDTLSFSGHAYGGSVCFRAVSPDSFIYEGEGMVLNVCLTKRTARLDVSIASVNVVPQIFSSFKWFFVFMVLANGGIPLHSSSIMYGGRGYLFLGPSGRGKSTISELLSTHLSGSVRGSDELNVAYINGNLKRMYSTPFYSSNGPGCFTGPITINDIYFLEQSKIHCILDISRSKIFEGLLRNLYHVPGNKELMTCMMETVSAVSKGAGFFVLKFNKEPSIAAYFKEFQECRNEI